MNTAFVNRSQARTYLHGHWKTAVYVEMICLCAELLLVVAEGVGFYRFGTIPLLPFALLVDLFLFSPLKAGRALFYDTLVTDSNTANLKLVVRFFRHGYARSVAWRLKIWLWRAGLYILLTIPSAAFLYISRLAEQKDSATFAMIAFAFSLIFLASALIITEILLLCYIPAVYLLTQVKEAKRAMHLSKRLSKGSNETWIGLHLDYAGWCFSLIFLFPVFYVSPLFQTARAATVRKLFLRISPRIHEQHLKRKKNHGRIRNEF